MSDQATRLREIAERYCGRPAEGKPHIITVASGKGGVGKSVIALSLAMRLADLGNRTLVADVDENLGNIDVMAGISPLRRLGNVVRGETDIGDAIVPITANLFLLAGNSGQAGYEPMGIEHQRQLLDQLSDLEIPLDYVILDTAAGIGQDVIGWAVQSHETLVVTNPEPTAVMDSYAMVKMISLTDDLVPLKVIVNGARSSDEADDAALKLQRAVKQFLNRHVHYLGSIPYDPNVPRAIMHQTPVVREYPYSGSSLALGELAEKVHGQKTAARVRRFQAA